ncbi:MAG TPA: hypothetical protein VJ783_24955 [Pirellulales bacterium]|nr:hypothetical protein [Pirellulales bacterium]
MATGFQFSIRFLLTATTLIAAGVRAVTVEPSWQAGIGSLVVALSLPAVLLAGTVYARDWTQAFCLGATVPATTALVGVVGFGLLGLGRLLSAVALFALAFWLLRIAFDSEEHRPVCCVTVMLVAVAFALWSFWSSVR